MTAWRLDEAECAELVELLVGLVASPSPDPPGNEAAVAGFLIGWLEERGFDVTRDEFAPDRINVLARLKGDGSKPALIFSAHMDTLPIGDGDWGHPAFGAEIEDGKLYGRGATDMKSGLAAMAAAALKLRRADVALAGDLILAFSAGESSNLLGAERMVEAGNLKGAGALLVSEPTSLGLVTAEAGALWLRVVASGRPGHASAGTADNAILKLMDFLADVRTNPFADKTNPLLGTATLAINTISGGTAVNLTADRAEATLDIRTIPGLTTADVLARLRAIAGEAIVIDVMDENHRWSPIPPIPLPRPVWMPSKLSEACARNPVVSVIFPIPPPSYRPSIYPGSSSAPAKSAQAASAMSGWRWMIWRPPPKFLRKLRCVCLALIERADHAIIVSVLTESEKFIIDRENRPDLIAIRTTISDYNLGNF